MKHLILLLLIYLSASTHAAFAQSELKVYDKQEIIQARASWFLARRTVNAEFPTAHYVQVQKAVDAFEKNRLSKSSAVSNSVWTSVGPSAIVNTGYHNYTGRIISVNVSPFDTNVVLIGTAGGGIWKSTNGGIGWSPRSDNLGSLAVSCFARHPSDPNIIYAGTGEPSFVGNAIDGIGVIKSTDGGDTWTTTGPLGILLTHIAGIVVNQNNPNILVVANYYNSADPVTNGIYRSTNAGATWQTTNASGTEFRPSSLVGHPMNNDTLYALMGRTVTPNQNGFWKSTNAGASWTLLANGSAQGLPDLRNQGGKSVMSICQSQPNVLYAIFSNGINGKDELSGLFKSTNGGLNWTNANLPDQSSGGLTFFNGQGLYDIYVAVNPSNPNIVYAGGIDTWRTTNGGSNWTNITLGYSSRKVHPDQQAFAFNPLNPNTIYLAGDGGIMKSYNGGQSFVDLNNGLQITQFIGLAVSAQDTNLIVAGSQDNGTELFEGNVQWDFVADGDGGFTEIDPSNSNIQYSQRYHVAPDNFSQTKTTNRWASYSGINSGLTAADRSEFYVPYTMDENVPTRLYLGSFRVYRTVNSGSTWTAVSGDITGGEQHTITAIRVAKNNSNYVCAGTFNGRLSLSTNAGTSWAYIYTAALPQRPVSDIVFRFTDENTLYVAFQGFAQLGQGDNKGHIWKTNNAGSAWINISGNLPDIPVNALALNPADTLDIVAGTDVGIFRTTDGGVNWEPFNNGFPSGAFVMRFVVHHESGLLFASTHGRGAFKTKFFQPTVIAAIQPVKPLEAQAITLYAFVPEPGADATLYYGTNDLLTMDSTAMTFDGNKFTAQIPASVVTEKGLWYRIKTVHSVTEYFPSDSGRAHIAVTLKPSTIATILNNSLFAQGLTPHTWNTFSLPFESKVSLTKIFGAQKTDKFGVPTNWAAYSYNGSGISELVLSSGKGYVIQHTSSAALKITPDSGATADVNFFNSFFLKPGWNFLPWPFAFTAPITVSDPSKIGAVWTLYDNNWSHGTEFRPFSGYAVYNKTAGNIRASTVLSWQSVPAKLVSPTFPMIRFKCKAGTFEDNYNFIGMAKSSADGIDGRDDAEPPQFGKGLSLYFTKEQDPQLKLSSDMRSDNPNGHIWDMRVENSTGEAWITISWEKQNILSSSKAVLVDLTNNVYTELTEWSDSYTFKNEKENLFKIILGSTFYVEEKTRELQEKYPDRFALGANYPNPFNPSTYIPFTLARAGLVKLRIYNVLGQEVRTLKNEFLPTGPHTVVWDGKDQRGAPVSSGVYIYRLETSGFIQSRKMLLIK